MRRFNGSPRGGLANAPLAAIVALSLLWSLLIDHLALYWNNNPQYSYGWFVPALCAFACWRRWKSRPPAKVARPLGARLTLAATAFLFLPTWLVEQANPDWRFISWAMAGEVALVSFCLAYFSGGVAWAKHFAFPIVFIFSAVPWPFGIELSVVQGLMRGVATVTVQILGIFDIAALRHGNLIEVRTGTLGVDEACSGVRSLQAAIMISLFLGEFYRFTPAKRIGLVLLSVTAAIGCNIVRAFFLSWVASQRGLDAISKWHDPAGFTIQVFCFITVWLLAMRWEANSWAPSGDSSSNGPSSIPRRVFHGLTVWVLFSLVLTEAWYRCHEGRRREIQWTFDSTRGPATMEALPIEKSTAELLNFDEGRAVAWHGPDASVWRAFYFKWDGMSNRSRLAIGSHRPDICLPASGFELDSTPVRLAIQFDKTALTFSEFHFSRSKQGIFVFSCDGKNKPHEIGDGSSWSMRFAGLAAALRGERRINQQVIEVAVAGYEDQRAAESAFSEQIKQMIRFE